MLKKPSRGRQKPDFQLPPFERGEMFSSLDANASEEQYWLLQYGIQKWHEKGIDGSGVIVVVIDTGWDEFTATQGDLSGQIIGKVDGTGQGVADGNGHSTGCCGIIAANRNGAGVVGVAPGAKIVTAKGLTNSGSGSGQSLTRAYDLGCAEAMKHSSFAVITSNSYGGNGRIQSLENVIRKWQDGGVLTIAAAGNAGTDESVGYPASSPVVAAIGAHDENRRLASFSSRGAEVDLSAPGVQVLTTIPGGGYQKMSGTSFSCPWVAGAVALRLCAEHKALGKVVTKTMAQLAALFDACCVDAGQPGRDPAFGRGFLDIDKWLTHGLADAPPPPPDPNPQPSPDAKNYVIRVRSAEKPAVEEVA